MDPQTPVTAVEIVICEILASVLKLERIGVSDNFFELGLDSLLAIETVTRLEAALDTELPIVALFDHPSSRALASSLASASLSATA